jgi:hypothetical protein
MLGLATGTDGVLYGGSGNHIVTIDTATGAASPLSMWPLFNGGFSGVYGMDIAVPEPATALLLIGGAALAFRRKQPIRPR